MNSMKPLARIHTNFLMRISSLGRRKLTTSTGKPESDEEKAPVREKPMKKVSSKEKNSHKFKIKSFFQKNPHLAAIQKHIPEKYLALKRVSPPENLYLIDSEVAKKAACYIIQDVQNNQSQIVCETNAGLGLIASELLENGVGLVRLYEGCGEFIQYLKEKFQRYEGRVDLFTKDIFLLHRYEYIDKQDDGNRVEQLLQGVTKKSWDDDPVMTIIGCLPNKSFIRFLMKALAFQNLITSVGRIQLFAFMHPKDFVVLSAGPHLNLHTYQRTSVIFDLFFDYELIEKFPREVFLPWQSAKSLKLNRYPNQIDKDQMYFVKINFKRKLPVGLDNILPLYSFVQQFFGRGTTRVIPVLEKWVPGCGLDIMLPKLKHNDYFKDLNIFTQFGELTPLQVLAVFEETIHHPEYEKSHFMNIIESHLIKSETIESSLDDHLTEKINVNSADADQAL